MTVLKGIIALYSVRYADSVVRLLRAQDYRTLKFVSRFWQTNDLTTEIDRVAPLSQNDRYLRAAIAAGMLLQIGLGILYFVMWRGYHVAGSLAFAVALVLSYPVIWAHLAVVIVWLVRLSRFIMQPKAEGKRILCGILESQVVRLRQKHGFKVVAVSGSVGKTSTKLAIAHVLSSQHETIYQKGNYNDRLTVPLVIFGRSLPALFNVVAWAIIILKNERLIRSGTYDYKFAVVELGSDGPGQLQDFAYLRPDLSVVTAVAPEHMEYFKTLDAVATEELGVTDFSARTLVNASDTPAEYLKGKAVVTYGTTAGNDFHLVSSKLAADLSATHVALDLGTKKSLEFDAPVLGKAGSKIVLAAAASAKLLGLKQADIATALSSLPPVAGRMQVLLGAGETTIIDDTYNASPIAVKAGLDVLYAAKASQRIAILGNMNELGTYSKEAHAEVGDYCKPNKLDLVVTIGKDAKKYLAPAAVKAGCEVISCASPYEAGAIVSGRLQPGTVVLAEGSQNGVFAEEALKELLADPADKSRLVRQSRAWMNIKRKQFVA